MKTSHKACNMKKASSEATARTKITTAMKHRIILPNITHENDHDNISPFFDFKMTLKYKVKHYNMKEL
jgi:hypothetical protein